LRNFHSSKETSENEFILRSGNLLVKPGISEANTEEASIFKGGTWLLQPGAPGGLFSPERFNEEQRLIAQTVGEFVETEVLPNIDRIEAKEDCSIVKRLLLRCGEIGLLGMDTPISLGGSALDMASALIIIEQTSQYSSFATAYGAQTNLSILSILLFGSETQKKKYIPKLISGELVGAYALSESGAGSDPMAGSTRAERQPDGSYLLNGEKMWITNGGIADLITVFAKLNGQLTAFLVERTFQGVSSGKEEDKLGLRGSSTTTIVLQDARIPGENLLGEEGKGQNVAYNVLNFGRLRLGAMSIGTATHILGEAAQYASIRKQFGKPIASFGAIKHKLGEMTARLYATESATYRTAGLLDAYAAAHKLHDEDMSAVLAAGEIYAMEASIIKVAGSEMVNFLADENVQIHGAYGFVRDYPVERHFRDVRIYRIFEGTNEINRFLITNMLIKKARRGDLPLFKTAKKLREGLLSSYLDNDPDSDKTTGLDIVWPLVTNMKKTTLVLLSLAVDAFGEKLATEQETVFSISDSLIDAYLSESAVLRAVAAGDMGLPNARLHSAAAQVFIWDASIRVMTRAEQLIGILLNGDQRRLHLAAVRHAMRSMTINTIALRRELADAAGQKGAYPFRK
jgi:alkylation response protein AidB-like acyl-CoA dehydrogenase